MKPQNEDAKELTIWLGSAQYIIDALIAQLPPDKQATVQIIETDEKTVVTISIE